MSDLRNEDLQQLLHSLDDLDKEFEAGDLDEGDYRSLRNDYTVRAADAVRAKQERSPKRNPGGDGPQGTPDSSKTGSTSRRFVVVATLLVFAIGAGWLLARSAGERGIGEALTGSIDLSSRQRVIDCQQLGTNDGLLLEAIQCFDEVLATDPENVEALSYRAWFLVLASTSGETVTAEQRDELLASAAVYLDQAISIDPGYPDARAFRAVVADRQGDPEQVCTHIADLTAQEPPPFFLELTQPISDRNGC